MRNRKIRSVLVAWTLVVGAVSTVRAATPDVVPLPEAGLPALEGIVKTALAQSPRILARNLDLLAAEYQTLVSSSRLYPQIGGSFQYNLQNESRAGIPDPQATGNIIYNFSVTQAVWHWGAVKAAARIGELGRQVAGHNLDGGRRALAAEVRDAYLGLIVQKLGVRNSNFGEKIANENLARQEVRFKMGEITMGTILEHRLRADEASLLARKSHSDFDFAIKAFRRIAGIPEFSAEDVPTGIPVPLQEPRSGAAAEGSYLKSEMLMANELQIEQEKLQVKINARALWPKFNAVAGISKNDLFYTADLFQRQRVGIAFIGVQIQWSIFDGHAARGYRLQGLNRLRRLENSRSDMLETLKISSDQQAAAVGFTWSAYKNAAFRHRFAREGLDFERDSLGRGLSSEERVDAAQMTAYQTEIAAMDALARFFGASVRYASTMRADPLVDGFHNN